MNREIKFRGKDIVRGVWRYGQYMPPFFDGDSCFIWVREKVGDHYEYVSEQVSPETIGQFTGLKDANGVDIYEGDIIKSVDSNGEPIYHDIFYSETEGSFISGLDGRRGSLFGECHVYQSWINEFGKVVVGNIYDNPNLLKNKEE